MNVIKTYKIANKKKGQVEYGSRHGGVWEFKVGKYVKMTKVPGGKEVAAKIAEALHKSWLRTAGKVVKNDCERIDAICRRVIDRLTAIKSLADWKDEPEWWSNSSSATPAVKLVSPTIPQGISAEDISAESPAPVVAAETEPVLAEC